MESKRIYSSNTTVVRLIVYPKLENGIWGELNSLYREKPIYCKNIGDMLLSLDQLCNEADYFDALEQRGNFSKDKFDSEPGHPQEHGYGNSFKLQTRLRCMGNDELQNWIGCAANHTFFIEILFRQNDSMQGEILCKGEKRKRTFRSGLGLMKIIQEALTRERGALVCDSTESKESPTSFL